MAAISGGRATNERVKCLRIFADGNGETHMEDIDITLQPRKHCKFAPSSLLLTQSGHGGSGLLPCKVTPKPHFAGRESLM